jgi:hypothetical protein
MRDRLTSQQEEFVRLVIEDGHSFVSAYRLTYPPRNGTRSVRAEYVAAKRLAHRPAIEQRMQRLQEQLLAGDPVEMRRRAHAVLGRILSQQLDPRYRRTAMDVLNYLDAQEQAVKKAGWEAYHAAAAEIAALDAVETGKRNRGRSPSGRNARKALHREAEVEIGSDEANELNIQLAETAEDAERRRAEIFQVVSDRQEMRLREVPVVPRIRETDSRQDDPSPTRKEVIREVVLKRKPGHFGKGGWMRWPNSL